MFSTPEFWVLISTLLFVGLLVYLKVPGQVTAALDARADKISGEIDQAQQLREEAHALLLQCQERAQGAEEEAKLIIKQAKDTAKALEKQAKADLEQSIKRRERLFEEKIARAEAQAIKDITSAASDLAVDVAHGVIKTRAQGAAGTKLVDDAIARLDTQMNS